MIRRSFGICVGMATLASMQVGDEARAQTQPKVAVKDFAEPAGSEDAKLASQLKEMIRTALINTKKFTVISRDFNAAEQEAQLRRAGKTTRGRSGSTAQFDSVDFLIEGSITSAQLTQKRNGLGDAMDKLFLGGKGIAGGCTSGVFSVSIDVRVTNLGTGQTPYGESLTQSLESDCSRAGGAVDFPVVMRTLANRLAFEFSTNIYPMKVIDTPPDGSFVFNYGDNFIPIGTVIRITTPSQEIQSDGATLKRVGTSLGSACVFGANSDTAVARLIGGSAATVPLGSVAQIEALPSYDKKKKKWTLCKV